jgi:hypothetical protein
VSLDHDPRLDLVGSLDDVAVIEPNPALHPHRWAAYRNSCYWLCCHLTKQCYRYFGDAPLAITNGAVTVLALSLVQADGRQRDTRYNARGRQLCPNTEEVRESQ